MAYEINGTYGSHMTPCTIFVNEDGWYAVEGSKNINLAPDIGLLINGVDVEEIRDIDSMSADEPIWSVDDLEKEVSPEDEYKTFPVGSVIEAWAGPQEFIGVPLVVVEIENGEHTLETLSGEEVDFAPTYDDIIMFADSREEAIERLNRDRFYVVAFDETDFWREDIGKKAGKIQGYYLVDTKVQLYPADTRPHLEGHFLYNRVENFENFTKDELGEIESDPGREDAPMFLLNDVRQAIENGAAIMENPGSQYDLIYSEDNKDDYYSDIECLIDGLKGNPVEVNISTMDASKIIESLSQNKSEDLKV